MSRRKKQKRGNGTFVQLHNWVLNSEAWTTMKPGPRALYVEIKRRFNGSNNGRIFLSHRDAAKALCIGRDTVASYYRELTERGFLTITRGHHLGPEGIGQSALYALTEEPLNGSPATKEFVLWKKQKPRRKNRHSMAGISHTPCQKNQLSNSRMSENPTAQPEKPFSTVSEIAAISTSNHMVQGERPIKEQAAAAPLDDVSFELKRKGGPKPETLKALERQTNDKTNWNPKNEV